MFVKLGMLGAFPIRFSDIVGHSCPLLVQFCFQEQICDQLKVLCDQCMGPNPPVENHRVRSACMQMERMECLQASKEDIHLQRAEKGKAWYQ